MVTQPTEQYFKDGVWGWDASRWRKLALLWGYTDIWVENLGTADADAGNYLAATVAVPAGYVYVLEHLTIRNKTGARGAVYLSIGDGSPWVYVVVNLTPAQHIPDAFNGPITLKAGYQARVYMASVLANDAIDAAAWGYKMAVT